MKKTTVMRELARRGTPQAAVISPLLAKVVLHYTMDEGKAGGSEKAGGPGFASCTPCAESQVVLPHCG